MKQLEEVLRLIEGDPHQPGSRPCVTCRKISAIAGRAFGCEKKAGHLPLTPQDRIAPPAVKPPKQKPYELLADGICIGVLEPGRLVMLSEPDQKPACWQFVIRANGRWKWALEKQYAGIVHHWQCGALNLDAFGAGRIINTEFPGDGGTVLEVAITKQDEAQSSRGGVLTASTVCFLICRCGAYGVRAWVDPRRADWTCAVCGQAMELVAASRSTMVRLSEAGLAALKAAIESANGRGE